MKKEINITPPDGYIIDEEKSTFNKIVFKEIESKLPTRWEDLGTISGYYINSYSNVVNNTNNNNAVKYLENTFATKEQAQAALALAQLSQLMKVYNDGWESDYTNGFEEKYMIYFWRGKIKKGGFVDFQCFLSFKTRELRDKFLENFRDLIEQAKPLL